ncbi:TRAP-type C4-dicarboxylate transport system permease small subunit [Vreelandella songnenensis]|uniref:TRAP transporter small permease protein n=1 Tax=Vreelandella songnenensis TaxID=1176243 RepID=A0A2T0V6F4_9GAMM|nr:TRAP transporter small permease [Halomonas songnenensis]PRY65750.1 TRAP-type C4-dicarboxylate transport system permease small subunit [Halomonas songnenensis]
MRKINDLIEKILLMLAGSLFAAFILTVLYQVVARNYLKISVSWTDEVAMACFIWSVFIGAAVALRNRKHYVIDIFPPQFVVTQRVLRLFGSLACLPLIYVLIVHGHVLVDMGWNRRSVALGTPMAYLFAALPVAGVAMVLFSIETLYDDISALLNRHPAKSTKEANGS